jgi:hypothetical protein
VLPLIHIGAGKVGSSFLHLSTVQASTLNKLASWCLLRRASGSVVVTEVVLSDAGRVVGNEVNSGLAPEDQNKKAVSSAVALKTTCDGNHLCG